MNFVKAGRQNQGASAARVDARAFIKPMQPAASVQRRQNAFVISWQPIAEHVRVFVGRSPQAMQRQRPLLHVSQQQEAVIGGLDMGARPYFELAFSGGAADGQRILVSERVMPLQGAVNFRDIGGYEAKDGRFVRWGQVYRAGMLANLTPADQAFLQQLGLRQVCDLRSEEEVARRPDRLPDGLQLAPRPMQSVDSVSRLRSLFIVLFQRRRLAALMQRGYNEMILDRHGPLIGEIFRWLAADDTRPMLLHCTAGKDRTGMIVALLLHVLGVPQETILADYTYSNHYYDHFRSELAPDVAPLLKFGVTIDDLWPLLIVDPQTLTGAFSHIHQKYGSVTAYLQQQAGVDTAVIAQLRQKLLQPAPSATVES